MYLIMKSLKLLFNLLRIVFGTISILLFLIAFTAFANTEITGMIKAVLFLVGFATLTVLCEYIINLLSKKESLNKKAQVITPQNIKSDKDGSVDEINKLTVEEIQWREEFNKVVLEIKALSGLPMNNKVETDIKRCKEQLKLLQAKHSELKSGEQIDEMLKNLETKVNSEVINELLKKYGY